MLCKALATFHFSKTCRTVIDLESSYYNAGKSFCDNLYDFTEQNPQHPGAPQVGDEPDEDEIPYAVNSVSCRHWQRIMRYIDDKALWTPMDWHVVWMNNRGIPHVIVTSKPIWIL